MKKMILNVFKKSSFVAILIIAFIVLTFTVQKSKAGSGGGGSTPSVTCKAPWDNVCYKVYVNGICIKTEHGVASIEL
jgi:hypothetical protein